MLDVCNKWFTGYIFCFGPVPNVLFCWFKNVICDSQGILSALVLSVIPLIRPYQWQSLLMPVMLLCCRPFKTNSYVRISFPGYWIIFAYQFLTLTLYMNFQVLPNDMLDFLDAPVPYVVSSLILCVPARRKYSSPILGFCVSHFSLLLRMRSLVHQNSKALILDSDYSDMFWKCDRKPLLFVLRLHKIFLAFFVVVVGWCGGNCHTSRAGHKAWFGWGAWGGFCSRFLHFLCLLGISIHHFESCLYFIYIFFF